MVGILVAFWQIFFFLISLRSAETQLSDKHGFFLICEWKQSRLCCSFPSLQAGLWSAARIGPSPSSWTVLPPLGLGGLTVTHSPATGASVSPCNISFSVVRRRKQNYGLDSSLAHGGDFRGKDVVNARCFLYVTSTVVKRLGRFWKPSVIVCSPDSSERASRWPESLGCFEDAVLCGSSTSGSCAANQQTREISLSSGCACNGLRLQLLSR